MSDRRTDEPVPPPARRSAWIAWLERRVNLTELFSFLTHFGIVYTPIDTTRPFAEVTRDLAAQRVPSYTRGPRVLGLLAAILFGLQVVTGVLLAYYYRPTPEAAYESTRTIVRDLPAGWFLHQMHAWGSYLLVAVVVLRLIRFFWDGIYRAPRELLWVSAVLLVWIALQLDFTGGLLTWDARSYWATVRGLEVIWSQPVLGPVLAFLLGGRVVNEDVLIRFYVLHLLVLPVFYAGFLYLTFATLRRVGLSAAPETPQQPGTTMREHLFSMAMLTIVLFAVLVTMATLVPFRFVGAADPYATPGGVRPPWYLLAPYAVIEGSRLPRSVSGLAVLAVGLATLLLPFWARGEGPAFDRRLRWAGLALLASWVALTVVGAIMERA
jgi:quinol-cytochrome oxidoreductase complex cytochrome b subunit